MLLRGKMMLPENSFESKYAKGRNTTLYVNEMFIVQYFIEKCKENENFEEIFQFPEIIATTDLGRFVEQLEFCVKF
ncbi:MAG: hypothetical protein LBJ67_10120 [Planctomycetaceae bacterium]|nr:hypothetical protein [Planctomycetaceae bacterium]